MFQVQLAGIFVVAVANLASGQQSCPEKMDMMMTCLNNLKSNQDYKSIIQKKLAAAKTCGASDKNTKCWQAADNCEVDAETSTKRDPSFQSAMQKSNQCYVNFPNSPLAGIQSLFEGWGHMKGGHGGMKGEKGGNKTANVQGGPQQYKQPETGEAAGAGEMDSGSSEEDDHGFPADCKPTGDMKTMKQCAMDALAKDQSIGQAVKRLIPQVKKCEDTLPMECEPLDKKLHGCLKTALDPYMKVWKANYADCMSKAGFTF